MRPAILASVVLLLCTGCVTSAIVNTRLEQFEPNQGYRLQNLATGEENSDTLLVILTFSGGGTRAASLAYGVLEQMRETTIRWEGEQRSLLDEVDIISSVSGGSLPAAYFALFGERTFEDFPEKVLYKNLEGSIIRRFLLPPDNFKVLSPFYTRTDILAQNFDRDIFEGKTYGDLRALSERPFLVVNATDMARGRRFEFTQNQFDLLYSDLDTYRIGHAVAASAAFPGAFPPIIVYNFEPGADFALPDWAQRALAEGNTDSAAYREARNMESYIQPEREYVHLSDGGTADNLGLLPVIQSLRRADEGFAPVPHGLYERAETILVITVNAKTQPPKNWGTLRSPLGLLATLLATSSTPLGNFTQAQIEYFRLLIENRNIEAQLNKTKPQPPSIHFVELSFEDIRDPEQRRILNEMPTRFKLKREQVDQIRAAGAQLLQTNADFARFLESIE